MNSIIHVKMYWKLTFWININQIWNSPSKRWIFTLFLKKQFRTFSELMQRWCWKHIRDLRNLILVHVYSKPLKSVSELLWITIIYKIKSKGYLIIKKKKYPFKQYWANILCTKAPLRTPIYLVLWCFVLMNDLLNFLYILKF